MLMSAHIRTLINIHIIPISRKYKNLDFERIHPYGVRTRRSFIQQTLLRRMRTSPQYGFVQDQDFLPRRGDLSQTLKVPAPKSLEIK